jgi:membrane protein DedA with SNARE-associated domain
MWQDFFLDQLHRYGYGVVGVVIMLESMGAPLPGESLLIAAALYAATTGRIDITLVVAVASIGAIVGDNLGYLIGRSLGTRLLSHFGRRVGLSDDRIKLGHYLFRRHGGIVVFFGRFIAVLRTFAALLAGANEMPWHLFLLYNALGGITWCVLYGFGAYMLGDVVRSVAAPIGIAIAIIALIVVVAAVLFVRRNEARLIAEAQNQSP